MNLDDPDGELAWKGEKEKNFGSVCADWEVGVRGIRLSVCVCVCVYDEYVCVCVS